MQTIGHNIFAEADDGTAGIPSDTLHALRKIQPTLSRPEILVIKAAAEAGGHEIKSPGWLAGCRSVVHIMIPQARVAIRVIYSQTHAEREGYRQEWEAQGWRYLSVPANTIHQLIESGKESVIRTDLEAAIKAAKKKGRP